MKGAALSSGCSCGLAGDQLSSYVTGTGKRVVSYGNCKPASNYDPARPDVNLEFYLDRLAQVRKKFAPFLEVENPLFSWCSGDEGL